MSLDDVIYIEKFPSIDLHGLDSQTARVFITDFINDNYKMGNTIIVIIHGIGTGTLRKVTSEVLSKNSRVLAYKTYYYNNGCTIAQIKENEKK